MTLLVRAAICIALSLPGCSDSDNAADVPKNEGGGHGGEGTGGSGDSGGTGFGAAASGGAIAEGGGDPRSECDELHSQFDGILSAAFEDVDTPGLAAAVFTGSCGMWASANGQSTDSIALSPTLGFRVGSVTKTFVAATVLALAAEGKLTLQSPLSTWFLDTYPEVSEITVRHLLNHSSGIFNYTDDASFDAALTQTPKKHWPPEDLVALALSHDPYFSPGDDWHYSNTNYLLLGLIVERVTGESVAHEIRNRFLEPLGLTSTFFEGEETVEVELAHGFSKSGLDLTNYFDPSWAWAAGAMISSPGDLVRWAQALYTGAALDASSTEAMLETIETGDFGLRYGLGVFLLEPSIAYVETVGHMGDLPGYHTQMFFVPEQNVAFAAITNSDDDQPNSFTALVLEHLANNR